MVSSDAFAFRLRGCPTSVREAALREKLSAAFAIAPDDIRIHSLASAPWETPPTKTATLTFARLPSVIDIKAKKEWRIEGHGLQGLILDTHFLGLTPLNDVDAQKHEFEYVSKSVSYVA